MTVLGSGTEVPEGAATIRLYKAAHTVSLLIKVNCPLQWHGGTYALAYGSETPLRGFDE